MSARTGYNAGGCGDPALNWYGTEEECRQMSRSGFHEALTVPEPAARSAAVSDLIDDWRFGRKTRREVMREGSRLGISATVLSMIVTDPPLAEGHPLRQANNPVDLPGPSEPEPYRRLAIDALETMPEPGTCLACNGSGNASDPAYPCFRCDGSGNSPWTKAETKQMAEYKATLLGQSLDAEAEAEDALQAAVTGKEPDWLSAEMQYGYEPVEQRDASGRVQCPDCQEFDGNHAEWCMG